MKMLLPSRNTAGFPVGIRVSDPSLKKKIEAL
jgi:hypothetical protein